MNLKLIFENIIQKRNEKEARKYCKTTLDFKQDHIGNLIFDPFPKEIVPCITAHMDTVFEAYGKVKKEIIHINDPENGFEDVYTSPLGLGGDDYCGVSICLDLATKHKLKVILFSKEEVGGIGSRNIKITELNNVKYIINLDRRGSSDIITEDYRTKYCSEKFSEKVCEMGKDFEFKATKGVFSDMSVIRSRRPNLETINLSVGYYRPHSVEEYVSFPSLENTSKFVEKLIKEL